MTAELIVPRGLTLTTRSQEGRMLATISIAPFLSYQEIAHVESSLPTYYLANKEVNQSHFRQHSFVRSEFGVNALMQHIVSLQDEVGATKLGFFEDELLWGIADVGDHLAAVLRQELTALVTVEHL